MKNEKYSVSNETREYEGRILYRIIAEKDNPDLNIKKGDIGGWIESEDNLSINNSCWIYDEAIAMGNAIVRDDAILSGKAIVEGYSIVSDRSVVKDNVMLSGCSYLYGSSVIFGDAKIDCGEDGPTIPKDSQINFNVNYGCHFMRIVFSYEGSALHVSENGLICFGYRSANDFNGGLNDFRQYIDNMFKGSYCSEELIAPLLAENYIERMKEMRKEL